MARTCVRLIIDAWDVFYNLPDESSIVYALKARSGKGNQVDVDGAVANQIEGSASPRLSVFHAWWRIGVNPSQNTLLRWAARSPGWWTVSSLLLGMALWGVSSAFRYGSEAFIHGEGRTLPVPPPSTAQLLRDGLVGSVTYLIFAAFAAALLALFTSRTIGRYSTRYRRALAIWTISLVGPLVLETIRTIVVALLASLPDIAVLVNPEIVGNGTLVGGLILFIVYISTVTNVYLLVLAVQAGRVSMGREPAFAFVLLATLSLILNLSLIWATAVVGMLH